jgi:hypothetical protein
MRVGALVVMWSLWPCRNDKVFNDNNIILSYRLSTYVHIYRYAPFVVFTLQDGESKPIYEGLYTQLEDTARDTFSLYGWLIRLKRIYNF